MRNSREARVGDTFYRQGHRVEPFPGFKPAKSMVFAGVYPIESDDFERLRTAIERLTLNDASVSVQKENSSSLGMGFRCGFLGLLHMDVFRQRLEQEHASPVIVTVPTVPYRVKLLTGEEVMVESAAEFPDPIKIDWIEEPMIVATIVSPKQYFGQIMSLCMEKRGEQLEVSALDETRLLIRYRLPLSEVVVDFHDLLKSSTQGYASFDYDEADYQQAEIIKLTIMLNGSLVDPLSFLCHKDKAQILGRKTVSKLKELIPRQMFEVAIQAAVANKVIARETLQALRKNVTAKCYGGDVTRKKKLLEKQKEGKKKMRKFGNVEIAPSTFVDLLKVS
eukprot:GILI01027316.1.p1 GENE.GILI01027316.1~~GILI01027316.1.p1  ORF type:complete len:390 (-),score=97.57 GILI01027316.1:58-1062(-)